MFTVKSRIDIQSEILEYSLELKSYSVQSLPIKWVFNSMKSSLLSGYKIQSMLCGLETVRFSCIAETFQIS